MPMETSLIWTWTMDLFRTCFVLFTRHWTMSWGPPLHLCSYGFHGPCSTNSTCLPCTTSLDPRGDTRSFLCCRAMPMVLKRVLLDATRNIYWTPGIHLAQDLFYCCLNWSVNSKKNLCRVDHLKLILCYRTKLYQPRTLLLILFVVGPGDTEH